MSKSRIVLGMKVRNNAVSAENRAFQAMILPHQTYQGRELSEHMGDYLGTGSDGFRAERMVTGIESFIITPGAVLNIAGTNKPSTSSSYHTLCRGC